MDDGSQISSWRKAKDAMLVGLATVAVAGLLGVVSLLLSMQKELAEIKVSIAVYQSESASLRAEVARIRVEIDDHFREARKK